MRYRIRQIFHTAGCNPWHIHMAPTWLRPGPRDTAKLLTLALGVIFFHTIVTVLEEELFSLEEFKHAAGGAFMTLFMYSCTAFVYLPIVMRARRSDAGRERRVSSAASSRMALLKVSMIYVGTTTLTKTSLRYIDMPTQTVLKSAKLLPVMAGSILILGKRYSPREWFAAACLCAGIALFNLSTHFPEPRATLAGALCIVIALACDALLGPYQKRVMDAGITVAELMCAQSACGGVLMLFTCVLDGTLGPGLYLLVSDARVCATLMSWTLCITAGTALVLRLVDEYSAVTAIVVTTVRKALTLFASFILFPKHIGIGHPLGAALVFGSAFITLKKPPPRRQAEQQPLLPVHSFVRS